MNTNTTPTVRSDDEGNSDDDPLLASRNTQLLIDTCLAGGEDADEFKDEEISSIVDGESFVDVEDEEQSDDPQGIRSDKDEVSQKRRKTSDWHTGVCDFQI